MIFIFEFSFKNGLCLKMSSKNPVGIEYQRLFTLDKIRASKVEVLLTNSQPREGLNLKEEFNPLKKINLF